MSMRHAAQTLLGMVLAVTPVTLWIAWSPGMLAGALALGLLCAALLVLLTESRSESTPPARLPEEFFEEVQQLHPMIYHHSGRQSSRFHRTMRRLSQMVKASGRGAAPR
jgi:hypothetical protein